MYSFVDVTTAIGVARLRTLIFLRVWVHTMEKNRMGEGFFKPLRVTWYFKNVRKKNSSNNEKKL